MSEEADLSAAGQPQKVSKVRGVIAGAGKTHRGNVPLLSAARLGHVASAMEMQLRAAEAAARAAEAAGTVVPVETPDVVKLRKYVQTLYTPEMCAAMADDLVEWCLDRLAKGQKVILLRWCVEKGVHKRRLYDLEGRNKMFAEALEFARTVQELSLIEGGLDRRFQADVAKLLLMAEHGMAERHDLTATAAGGMPASVEEADRRIEELRSHRAVLTGILDQAQQLGTGIVDG